MAKNYVVVKDGEIKMFVRSFNIDGRIAKQYIKDGYEYIETNEKNSEDLSLVDGEIVIDSDKRNNRLRLEARPSNSEMIEALIKGDVGLIASYKAILTGGQ